MPNAVLELEDQQVCFEEKKVYFDKTTGLIIGGSAIVATSIVGQPAFAQNAIDDIQSTLNTIGTIAGVAGGIVVVSLGIRLAIKQVNRIMTKG